VPVDEAHLPDFDPDATEVVYDAWHGYWKLERDGSAPRYPFGFGLGYATLAVRDVAVHLHAGELVVSATVANDGDRSGVEVVQVYVAPTGRPAKLAGFARVEVAAGKVVPAEVRVPLGALAQRVDGTWVPAEGAAVVRVGRFAGDPDAVEVAVDLPG
jgi:hypothetical protein